MPSVGAPDCNSPHKDVPKPDPCRRPGAGSKLENLDGLAVDPSADGLGVNNRLIARRGHQLPANAPARRAPAVMHWTARLEAGVPGRAAPVATGPSGSPLTRDIDVQVLDARLLNWLRIELHQ